MHPYSQLIILALCGACGVTAGGGRKTKTTGAAPRTGGCLAIVNGEETSAYPAVVLLTQLNADGDVVGICTGAFIAENAILTAAHCVPGGGDARLAYAIDGSPAGAKKLPQMVIIDAPELGADEAGAHEANINDANRDAAVLVFDANVAPGTLALNTAVPGNGEAVDLVGYGLKELPKDAQAAQAFGNEPVTKRHGKNTLVYPADVSADLNGVFFVGGDLAFTEGSLSSQRSLAAPGDSGGPLLSAGKILGVASLAGLTADSPSLGALVDQRPGINVYSDVRNAALTALLKRAKEAGASIGVATKVGAGNGSGTGAGTGSASVSRPVAASANAGGTGTPCP